MAVAVVMMILVGAGGRNCKTSRMSGSSNYDHFDMWCFMGDLPEFLRNKRNENYGLP